MRDFFEIFVPIFGSIAFIIVLVFVPIVYFDMASCSAYSEMTGRQTKYKMLTCYVQKENLQFVPKEEFDLRAITNE